MKGVITLLLMLLICGCSNSQNYSGSYNIINSGQEIRINLEQKSDGNVTGNMALSGILFNIKGKLEDGKVSGNMEGSVELLKFTAELINNKLNVTFFDPAYEKPEEDEFAESVILNRAGDEFAYDSESSDRNTNKAKSGAGKVIVNNIVLTEKQIAEIQSTYKVKPLPGNYWYDSMCGLYGVVGYPAYGFMYPNHKFGKLDQKASNGNTGVFVNGRELPQQEWFVWSKLLGYYIQPGRYWLAANGDAGYEGSPIPTVNLYTAAKQNSYSSGDNIWSTRFSAGNYDQGNQRGYVSVPGYGPVGYGF